ncbi:Os05g0446000 [Oryza sativa Japonica Group]|uniref:Os05g0446000 protein n=1 Tax=Oryza sativa subsp. japonica TaxID=39947 RepID=Q65WT3_ORYSJ|nr:unknow protein [Oryza sativa Japonica Group]BAH93180.1 Os05g0446000 [Oryza sativa Japonica Group]|eukprot:NP_001174452.1 Os05g0446000 [Oryza sativa Japonica Group]
MGTIQSMHLCIFSQMAYTLKLPTLKVKEKLANCNNQRKLLSVTASVSWNRLWRKFRVKILKNQVA